MIHNIYYNLYIGDFQDAKEHGKDYDLIVSCGKEHEFNDVGHVIFPMVDGEYDKNEICFVSAISFVYNYMTMYPIKKILVHCHGGISRSVAVVLGVLMQHNIQYDTAWNMVAKLRPASSPNYDFIRLLRKMDDVDVVIRKCYKKVLRRLPDNSGLISYGRMMRDRKIDEQKLLLILEDSDEYKRKSR